MIFKGKEINSFHISNEKINKKDKNFKNLIYQVNNISIETSSDSSSEEQINSRV
jgi:predicted SprT family Zn-dependent metalloprotease